MSVDYDSCDCCKESLYDEYVGHCSKCGHRLCTDCLINDDIGSAYAYDYGIICDGTKEQAEEFGIDLDEYKVGDHIDDAGIDHKYCPFCSGSQKVHDDDLLDFTLGKLGLTRDEAAEIYKKEREQHEHGNKVEDGRFI